tara:strand:- start:34 stop:219 length:186 start_codon:yes stop_codon:yes gene_type:complete
LEFNAYRLNVIKKNKIILVLKKIFRFPFIRFLKNSPYLDILKNKIIMSVLDTTTDAITKKI